MSLLGLGLAAFTLPTILRQTGILSEESMPAGAAMAMNQGTVLGASGAARAIFQWHVQEANQDLNRAARTIGEGKRDAAAQAIGAAHAHIAGMRKAYEYLHAGDKARAADAVRNTQTRYPGIMADFSARFLRTSAKIAS